MRLLASVGITYFAWQTWLTYALTNKKIFLLLFATEFFTICLVIFAKQTATRDFSPLPVLLTIIASFYFFLIYLDKGITLIPEKLGEIMMIVGISIQIISKVYLGRNFGLLPARRGIVTKGPYQIVRHPIYFGYFITHMAFLLSLFSIHNLVVYVFLYTVQFGRIFYEEKKLSIDPNYQLYMQKVKYKFIPFLI